MIGQIKIIKMKQLNIKIIIHYMLMMKQVKWVY